MSFTSNSKDWFARVDGGATGATVGYSKRGYGRAYGVISISMVFVSLLTMAEE